MTTLTIYQVDAFSQTLFSGNPAAVIPLTHWLDDETMQAIAAENNLSETAFFIPVEDAYHIRWFTPTKEVALCGHATLACAHVLFEHLAYQDDEILFDSLSGSLKVRRDDNKLQLDFPSQPAVVCSTPPELVTGLRQTPEVCFKSEDYLAVFNSEEELAALSPDFAQLATLDLRGVIATAPSTHYDFVARFFAPRYGINEDPVTGSAFTQLIPYWAKRLEKNVLKAKQISSRGGEVFCEYKGSRVFIAGYGLTYLQGSIEIGE